MENARRITDRMMANWKVLKKANPLPFYETFSKESIKDIWENCFVLRVFEKKVTNYKFEYAGKEIVEALGRNPVGETLNTNVRGIPETNIILNVEEAVKKREPFVQEGIFINKKSHTIKYRACILPYTTAKNNNNSITHIVAGIAWQVRN